MLPTDPELRKYAEWQVSQIRGGDLEFWERLSEAEYRAVEPAIAEAGVPRTVLDLGCGLGRAAAHFAKYIPSPPTRYFLADSDGDNPTWEWNAQQGFYNSLALTKRFTESAGIADSQVVDLRTDALDRLSGIDLLVSFLSVGFHYPLEDYLPRLRKIASDNCVMAFGVRRGKYAPADFLSQFQSAYLVPGTSLSRGSRTKEDVLILSGKRVI